MIFRSGFTLSARFCLALSLSGALWSAATANDPRNWSPRQYGAVADGRTTDTKALQQAIDAAHEAGGGTVHLEAGVYRTGTLELRTGVTLDLEAGAVLLGSPSIADYRRGHWPALIKARGQERIAITGSGVIDGQGKLVAQDTLRIFEHGDLLEFFPGLKPDEKIFTGSGTGETAWIDPHAMQRKGTLRHRVAPRSREDASTWRVDEFMRPQLLEFWQCRNVRVSGVTLKNAANWVETYRDCDDVAISGIHVESTSYWNNDGLDLVNSRRVKIEDCEINAADDGICLKSDSSPEGRWCEDVTIARCRIRSSASALKFGTASHQGFRRIRAEDLEIYDTYRSAIALEAVDGGTIEDVKISRVHARNTGNAFFLRIGQRNQARPPGFLRNIELSDIDVQIPTGQPDEGYEHQGPRSKSPPTLSLRRSSVCRNDRWKMSCYATSPSPMGAEAGAIGRKCHGPNWDRFLKREPTTRSFQCLGNCRRGVPISDLRTTSQWRMSHSNWPREISAPPWSRTTFITLS